MSALKRFVRATTLTAALLTPGAVSPQAHETPSKPDNARSEPLPVIQGQNERFIKAFEDAFKKQPEPKTLGDLLGAARKAFNVAVEKTLEIPKNGTVQRNIPILILSRQTADGKTVTAGIPPEDDNTPRVNLFLGEPGFKGLDLKLKFREASVTTSNNGTSAIIVYSDPPVTTLHSVFQLQKNPVSGPINRGRGMTREGNDFVLAPK